MESTTATRSEKGRHGPNRGLELLARAGYAAKGLVYVAIGVLSAAAAAGAGSSPDAQGSREALTEISSWTFGTVLLWIVAIGLVAYVAWRVVQALADPEGRGTDAQGLATRALLLLSAFVHGALTLWVIRVLLGRGSGDAGGGDTSARTWSAELLSQPFGAWLLGAVALGIIAYGGIEMVKAWRASFERKLRRDLHGDRRRWVRRIARVGLVARGIVFWIIGGFLLFAAWTAQAGNARDLEGALETLRSQPYGPYLMGAVSLGLAAYGVLQWVKARYQRI